MSDKHGEFVWYELMTTDTKAAEDSMMPSSAGRPRTVACPTPAIRFSWRTVCALPA